jgi:hypothetical protein
VSKKLILHQEIQLAGRWEHYAVHYVDLYTIITALEQNIGENVLPKDCNRITQLDYEIQQQDVHLVKWIDEITVMWVEEYCGGLDFRRQVGYFLGTTWSSWFREPECWNRWKEFGLTGFRWIYFVIG